MERLTTRSGFAFVLLCSWAGAGCVGILNRDGGAPADLLQATPRAESPDAVVLPNGNVAVTWGAVNAAGDADIAFALLGSSTTLESAVRVNPFPLTAVAGRQVGPRVRVLPGGRLLITWVDRRWDSNGDVVIAHSDDEGRSFSPPVRVNDDAGLAGQEYHDVTVLPDGGIVVLWLDERDAPAESLNQKQIYYAISNDGGETFGQNHRLTHSPSGVCPCCRPCLTAAVDGTLHVVYRDRVGSGLRVRIRSWRPEADAFAPPVDVQTRTWEYRACPVDGPTVVAGEKDQVTVAWMDGTSGAETAWVATSTDGARTFSTPAALADEGNGDAAKADVHVQASTRPALVVSECLGTVGAWEDTQGGIRLRPIASRIEKSEEYVLADGSVGVARSVALVSAADTLHAFWTEEVVEVGRAVPLGPADDAGGIGITTTSKLRHGRIDCRAGELLVYVDELGEAVLTAGRRGD